VPQLWGGRGEKKSPFYSGLLLREVFFGIIEVWVLKGMNIGEEGDDQSHAGKRFSTIMYAVPHEPDR